MNFFDKLVIYILAAQKHNGSEPKYSRTSVAELLYTFYLPHGVLTAISFRIITQLIERLSYV